VNSRLFRPPQTSGHPSPESGAILPFFAIILLVLLALAAFAIDFGLPMSGTLNCKPLLMRRH
jgi:hypothetical protein